MWLKVLISMLLAEQITAHCDCQDSNYVACHSENTYSICLEGKPTYDNITCPTGLYCTDGMYICYSGNDIKPSCQIEEVPTTTVETTINTEEITTTTETTTTTTIEPISTTTESWDPVKSCEELTGALNLKNRDDPTCATFIYCYVENGHQKADVTKCGANKYYDEAIHKCTQTKPDGCT